MPKSVTLTQRAYEVLRAEILQGVRKPGSPLRTQELSSQLDVSMSVVREALVRLSEQHLVSLAPNIGFRVADVSPADLRDLVETRVDLESLALRRSIERGDLAWEAEVLASHHVLENTPMFREEHAGTTEEWTTAHNAFHDALLAACGSRRLLAFTRTLRDSAELYRQIGGALASRDRDVALEHRELLRLATSHRADGAVVALANHLRRTGEAFESVALP